MSALLLGLRLRLAALGAAGLLAIYGTSMMISLPVAEQFHYNVFVLAAGMLVLAGLTKIPLTLDAVLARQRLAAEQAQVGPHESVIGTGYAERETRIEDQAIQRAD